MSRLKWKKLRDARYAGAGDHKSKVLCRQLLLSAPLVAWSHVGQAAGTHSSGNASLLALLLCTVLAAALGTAWTQVPRWASTPGSCWPPAVAQARRKHTTAAPWEKPRHLPVTGPTLAGFRHFNTFLLSPVGSNFHLCDEGADKNHRKVPARLGYPPGPGRSNLLWLLAKVAWDVEEQLPRDSGQSFISPCVHTGWGKA